MITLSIVIVCRRGGCPDGIYEIHYKFAHCLDVKSIDLVAVGRKQHPGTDENPARGDRVRQGPLHAFEESFT